MGKFFGEFSGFLMIILIALLFVKLLWDLKIIKKTETISNFKKISLFTIGIGMMYLFVGGMIYNMKQGEQVSFAETSIIWNYGDFGKILIGLEGGNVQGIFNTIYVKLALAMGSIFFGQFLACSIYISFILSVLTIWIYFCGIKRILGETGAWYIITICLVFPYAFHLFLYSSISLICFFAAVLFYLIVRKGNYRVPDKVKLFQWNNFWMENLWLVTCILGGFVLFRDMVGR